MRFSVARSRHSTPATRSGYTKAQFLRLPNVEEASGPNIKLELYRAKGGCPELCDYNQGDELQKNQEGSEHPKAPKFASWRSFMDFSGAVRHDRRYIWNPKVQAFLETVVATAGTRELLIPAGERFYRAQKGVDYSSKLDPIGYDSRRMKPLSDRASEGRANPAGIPVLYLATSVETAVAETRPWVGADISVGTFKTVRDLKLVKFTRKEPASAFRIVGLSAIFGSEEISPEKVIEAVWADIDEAFSRPVSRDDSSTAEYAPTQILAELFKDAGYDGIAYNSHFNGGFNLALFDVLSADIVSCAPYEVTSIHVEVKQNGNDWYS